MEKPNPKQYLDVYNKISDLLVGEGLTPFAALAVISAMSEALYRMAASNPELFADEKGLANILGKAK